MKKSATILISLFLFSISLSGCGQEETQNNSQQDINYQSQKEKHISTSKLVPLDTLSITIETIEDIDKTDKIIVYCRSGSRSKVAYDILTQMGYTNVKSMSGGIKQWTSLGYNVCLGTSLTC